MIKNFQIWFFNNPSAESKCGREKNPDTLKPNRWQGGGRGVAIHVGGWRGGFGVAIYVGGCGYHCLTDLLISLRTVGTQRSHWQCGSTRSSCEFYFNTCNSWCFTRCASTRVHLELLVSLGLWVSQEVKEILAPPVQLGPQEILAVLVLPVKCPLPHPPSYT